jgi:hypothetical protein
MAQSALIEKANCLRPQAQAWLTHKAMRQSLR